MRIPKFLAYLCAIMIDITKSQNALYLTTAGS